MSSIKSELASLFTLLTSLKIIFTITTSLKNKFVLCLLKEDGRRSAGFSIYTKTSLNFSMLNITKYPCTP